MKIFRSDAIVNSEFQVIVNYTLTDLQQDSVITENIVFVNILSAIDKMNLWHIQQSARILTIS